MDSVKPIPEITCPQLLELDKADLGAIRNAFRAVKSLRFGQAWAATTPPQFFSGTASIAWNKTSFLVFAELEDKDIFTFARQDGERLWELGDTFEIFLRPINQQAYFEFHVASNNCRLQLHFADVNAAERAGRSRSLDEVILSGDVLRSRTWIHPEIQQWFVFAEISAAAMTGQAQPLRGSEWLFSFGRYDYTRSESSPVLSSTSAHAQLDFHRHHEWLKLQCD